MKYEIEIGDKVTYIPFLLNGSVSTLSDIKGRAASHLLLDNGTRLLNAPHDKLILVSKAKTNLIKLPKHRRA